MPNRRRGWNIMARKESDVYKEAETLWKMIDAFPDGSVHWTDDGEDVILEKQRFSRHARRDYKGLLHRKYLCIKMFMTLLNKFNFCIISQGDTVQFTSSYFKRDFKELIYVLPVDLSTDKSRNKTNGKQVDKYGSTKPYQELTTSEKGPTQSVDRQQLETQQQTEQQQQPIYSWFDEHMLNSHIEGDYQREPLNLSLRRHDLQEGSPSVFGDVRNTELVETPRVEPSTQTLHASINGAISEQILTSEVKQEGHLGDASCNLNLSSKSRGSSVQARSKSEDVNGVNENIHILPQSRDIDVAGKRNTAKVLEESAKSKSILTKEGVCICHDISETHGSSSSKVDRTFCDFNSSTHCEVHDCLYGKKLKHFPGCKAWRNILDQCPITMVPYIKTPFGLYPLEYIKTLCKEHGKSQNENQDHKATVVNRRFHAESNCKASQCENIPKGSSSNCVSSQPIGDTRDSSINQGPQQNQTFYCIPYHMNGNNTGKEDNATSHNDNGLVMRPAKLDVSANSEENPNGTLSGSGSLTDLSGFMGKVGDEFPVYNSV